MRFLSRPVAFLVCFLLALVGYRWAVQVDSAPPGAMPQFEASCWQQTLASGRLVEQVQQEADRRLSLITFADERYRIEERRDDAAWRVGRVCWHDRLIIDAGSSARLQDLEPLLAAHGWTVRDRIPGSGCASLTAPPAGLLEGLQRDGQLRRLLAGRAELEAETLEPLAATPNDSDWDEQWNMVAIGAPDAWELHTGDRDLVVPVFDTGVAYDHADLRANIFVNAGEIPGNGIDDDRNGYIDDIRGWDFLDRDADPDEGGEFEGHGTHVAGIIAAEGDNDAGTAGILWRARIMPIRVGSQSGVNTYAERAGLEYVRRWRTRRGAAIVASNHSYGAADATPSDQRRKAIGRYRDAGILFVAGAGNSGADNDSTAYYPSSFDLSDFPESGDWDNVLSVAASNAAGEPYSGSNYGASSVDLMAPGEAVWSVYPRGTTIPLTGTSQAAPHLTGAAALLASLHRGLDGPRLRSLLLETAAPKPAFAELVATGGQLDLAAAMRRAHALPQVDIVSPAAGSFLPAGAVIDLEAMVADGDGQVTRIEAWSGDALVASDESDEDGWRLRWAEAPIGRHALELVAFDDDGNQVRMRDPFIIDHGVMIRDDLDLSLDDITGDWDSAIAPEDGLYGESALQLSIPVGDERVAYDFIIPVAGSWAVDAHWPDSSLSSHATAYHITRSGDTETVIVDQRSDGGSWQALGRWPFVADEPVTITITPTEGVYRVNADAIRLRQILVPTRTVTLDHGEETILWELPGHSGSVEGDHTLFEGLDPALDHLFQALSPVESSG